MNFKANGIYPEPIVNYILHEYDGLPSVRHKIDFLKNNRPLPPLNTSEVVKEFASGNTIDINPGELLGLSMVTMYFNVLGENPGNTYQVVTGVEDTVKTYKEAFLSDGAIWHDQTRHKMLFQTTMAQGYVPKIDITAKEVAKSINKKVKQRNNYDVNCGLIVNVFADNFIIDMQELAGIANTSAFTSTYLVLYDLPSLAHAHVARISHPGSLEQSFRLIRHPREKNWKFNRA